MRVSSKEIAITIIITVAAAVAFSVSHRAMGAWNVDDAGITYAYSIRLADHGSLAASPETMPVEGYSNPLLFLFVAALRLLGLFDPITTHLVIEAGAFALVTALVYRLARPRVSLLGAVLGTVVFVGLELLCAATWKWYGSGLENVEVTLGLVTLAYLADRWPDRPNVVVCGVIAFGVALLRPEAPVYVAAFYGTVVVFRRPAGPAWSRHFARVAKALAVTAILYAAFLAWRHATYGAWLPNTYYAKLDGGSQLRANLIDYIWRDLFVYDESRWFALAALGLWVVPELRRLAGPMTALLAAALAMPLVAGADMMGDHRFGTPFLAMTHVCTGLLVAGLVRRDLRRVVVVVLVTIPIALLVHRGPLGGRGVSLNDVTISLVADLHGSRRVEHARRLGLIDPVVVAPDAGGPLLIGALQLVDNGFLTDFQMAHMTRTLTFATQYEVEERRADLVDTNPNWLFDRTLVGPRYLAQRDGRMFARRDLVDAEVPANVQPFYADPNLRIYLSPRTVPYAGMSGLMRLEVIVAWTGGAPSADTVLAGRFGDRDAISLEPYYDGVTLPDHGVQRRALLLGAPPVPGTFDVFCELRRGGEQLYRGAPLLARVLADASVPIAVGDVLAASPTAESAAFEVAWLREQLPPRLGMTAQRAEQAHLLVSVHSHARNAASALAALTWDARLAAFEPRSASVTAAEFLVVGSWLRSPGCESPICIARRVDALRRLGYFDVLTEVPEQRAALVHAADGLSGTDRYVALVAMTLAWPARIDLQRALLAARSAPFPLP